jgi:hypothetical protein
MDAPLGRYSDEVRHRRVDVHRAPLTRRDIHLEEVEREGIEERGALEAGLEGRPAADDPTGPQRELEALERFLALVHHTHAQVHVVVRPVRGRDREETKARCDLRVLRAQRRREAAEDQDRN